MFADGIRHFNIDATESLLADPSLRSLLLPTIRAEFEMAYRYRFQPTAAWDVPIVCFAGSQDTYATRDDMLEWRRFTASSFQLYLRQGVVTINEVRSEQGLPPVSWGDAPWLPNRLAQPGAG